ncbi:MAG: TauD/TfdA family dioxygenase [Actinomycetota bacterium]
MSGSIGAIVHDVDLAAVDDRAWAEIHAAWLRHLVLFFPAQELSAGELVALGRRLGELDVHPYLPKLDGHDEVVVLDSETGVRADFWHTDVAFSETPPTASILQLVESPPHGGDTMWSNQYLAYEQLSEPMQALLDGLTAVHDAGSHGDASAAATHPVVRVHPETGRRSLFVNGTSTSHLVELRRDESDALLRMLCEASVRPEHTCRYRWGRGDVAMWDNRCTQHYAIDDYDGTRIGRRVTVTGERPVGI